MSPGPGCHIMGGEGEVGRYYERGFVLFFLTFYLQADFCVHIMMRIEYT